MTMSEPFIVHIGRQCGPTRTMTISSGTAFLLANLMREQASRAEDKGYQQMLVEFAQDFEKAAKG